MNKIFIFDECLPFPSDLKNYPYLLIRLKDGTKDEEIIKLINIIAYPPVVLYTQNIEDFEGKLKNPHTVVKFSKDALQDCNTAFEYAVTTGTQSTKASKFRGYTITFDEKKRRKYTGT